MITKCGAQRSGQLLLVFGDFCSNLDWLDLEMEADEGEDQALQILHDLILITQTG